MKNRSLFRLLALAALMLVSGLNARAQAPDAFYVYKNDGSVMPFFNDIVDSVKWSHYDLNGVEHKAYVVQEVYTRDSLYRIPVELIDSIGFHKPENKYTADAVRMEQQPWWRYVAEFVDTLNIIKLRKDIPESLLPKVGDKLVTVVQNDIFPGGYMGKVIHIAPDPETGQQLLVCEPLDFKDVFVEFTATAGVVAQSKEAEARSNVRKRHIDLDKTIHWPKIDFLGSSFGLQVGKSEDLGHDVSGALSGDISWTWEPEYDIELWVHWSVETGLEYNYVHHESVNLKRSLNITGSGSWHKDKPFGHFKYAIPNCPLLWWYVEPGVFADFSVSAAINWFTQRKYKNYVFAKYSEYEPDLNVYTARTVDEGPGESSTTTFTLSGALSAGFYAEVGLRVPPYFVDTNNFEIVKDENSKYLIGRVQLGARIEGSAELNMNELIGGAFKDFSMYRMLNHEVSFALTAFLSGELKLQTPFGGTWSVSAPYEVTASLGTKFGIVPSFDNLDVTTGKLDSIYYAICNSDVARNLIIPVRNMGFTVRDSKGNTAARVGNRYYWMTTFKHMTDTIRGLEPGMKYSLHPSFDIFGIIPMLGYPKEDFTVGTLTLDFEPNPITATRERNVLRLPIKTNARQADVTVTDGTGWLQATTDSLTLLVRTDSLPGGTTREGKLKLKAMTSDKESFVEQEVKVIQTPLPMIELDPEAVNFLSTGGTERVTVRLKEPDRTVTVSGQPDWLGVAVSGSSITLTAQPNPDKYRPRTCTLTIIATDKGGSRAEQPLPVAQQCEQQALIVEPKLIELDALPPAGQNWVIETFLVKCLNAARNPEVSADKDLSWTAQNFDYNSYKQEGDYLVFEYSVGTQQVYLGEEPRSGKINIRVELTDGTFVEDFVTVTQKPAEPKYELSPGKITLMDKGNGMGDYSDLQRVTVETNLTQGTFNNEVAGVEITPSEDWLHTEGYWWGPISIYANMNIAPESRTGTVTVKLTMSNKTVIERTIYVTQKGTADDSKFKIDPARLEFPGAGGEKTLTIVPAQGVEIDRIWEVDCHTAGNSWLNGSGMNLTAIMVAEPNTTSVMRQRDFAITVLLKDGTKVTENFIAYQKPASIDLYPDRVRFDGMGGFQSVNIESSYEPVIITYDADWLTVERSGNGLFLTAQPNNNSNGQSRSVIVYLSTTAPDGSTVKKQLSVSQTSSSGFFRIEPSSFTFEGEGGTKTGNIHIGNDIKSLFTGQISITPSADWITYERTGSSNLSLKVTVAANPTAVQREGTITVTTTLSTGVVLTYSQRIIQQAGNVTPEELELLVGSDVKFDKNENYAYKSPWTNCDYITATANASWLTVNVDGEGRIVIYAPENSGATRTAKITVTGYKTDAPGATPRTITQYLNVTQEGNGQELNFDEYEISAIKVSYYVKCKDTDYRKDGTIKDESFKNYSNEFTLYAEDPDLDYRPLIGNFQATPISGGVHLKVVGTMEDHTANSVEFDLTGIGSDMKGGTINMCNLIMGRYGAYQIPAEFTADNILYNGKDSDWSVWEATEQAGLRISDFECYRLTKPNAANGYNEYCYASDPSNEVRISLKFRKKEKQDNPGGDSKYKINSVEVRSKVSTTLTTYVLNKPTESPYPQETSRTYVLSSPKVSVKGNDLHVEGTDIEGAGHQWNGNISFDIVGGANNLNAGVIKNLNVDSHWKEGTKEEETKYFADGVKFEGMNSGRYDYRTAKNSYYADFIVKNFCYWWSNSTTKEEYKQSDKDSYTIEVLINADEVQQKDYSGAFIGEWHNGSTTLILRSDGTYSKRVGSAAAVTGTYELLSYSIDESNQKFSGSIKEPSGKVVSFSGTYTGNILWPSGMTYDGITYRFDDGM